MISDIYKGSEVDRKELLEQTVTVLQKGVTKGYGKQLTDVTFDSPDWIMLNQLHYNVGVFAAFKNHNQITDTVSLLRKEDGELRSWDDFRKEALKLDNSYNTVWLKTEYHHAVSSTRAASRWQDIQRTKHLYPNLMYVAVNDTRTRQMHKNWHGIILPIDHKFWDTHYAPNDYGCRCNVKRTDKEIDTKGYEVNDMPELPIMFNQNSGKSGEVFDQTHPYYNSREYKTVAKFAQEALLDFQRNDIQQYVEKEGLLKKVFKSQLGNVKLNSSGVKRILNQAHQNQYARNNLFYDLENVLDQALYVKSDTDKKGIEYHYLHIKVNNQSMYISVKELKSGKFQLHTIIDRLKG